MSNKICNNCKKEIPANWKFCHYCGSKDISNENKKAISNTNEFNDGVIKKCKECGKELPIDSNFCQYCGSKKIVKIKPEPNSDTLNESSNNQNNNSLLIKSKDYKKLFIIACAVAAVALLISIGLYSNNTSLEKEIATLNNKLETAEEDFKTAESKRKAAETNVSNYRTNANKYDSVSKLANQTLYNDFRADTYFVRGTSKTVNIYCNFNTYGSYTIQPSVSGTGIGLTWGEWYGSGYNNHTQLFVTCTPSGYGTITLTNTFNNHKVIIYVTGN